MGGLRGRDGGTRRGGGRIGNNDLVGRVHVLGKGRIAANGWWRENRASIVVDVAVQIVDVITNEIGASRRWWIVIDGKRGWPGGGIVYCWNRSGTGGNIVDGIQGGYGSGSIVVVDLRTDGVAKGVASAARKDIGNHRRNGIRHGDTTAASIRGRRRNGQALSVFRSPRLVAVKDIVGIPSVVVIRRHGPYPSVKPGVESGTGLQLAILNVI